jgi:hypothetical protein
MKKVLSIATLVGISGLVHATNITVTAPSSLDTLSGSDAYSWGIAIGAGQTVTSASINWSGVDYLAAGSNPTGYIFTDLLELSTTGVNTISTGELNHDYWSTSGTTYTSVGTMTFPSVGTTLSMSYILTGAELTALNAYLTADHGIFDIGISPDCHYSVGGLTFVYSLGTTNGATVPDGATTALLLGLGLAGLEIFRRQFVAVRVKA